MDLPNHTKKILLPPIAGPEVLEQYDLYCEDRYTWRTRFHAAMLARTISGHAPFDYARGGESVRLNVASPDAEFRAWSLDILTNYLRTAAETTPARTIVTHSAPRFWTEDAGRPCALKQVGEYGRVVESLKAAARLAGELGLRLVLENNCTRWDEIAPGEAFDPDYHIGRVKQYFSTYPEEWRQLHDDVDEPAFGLCMDTSHATNFSHRFAAQQRPAVYHRFIDLAGDRLWHVHWNDNWMDAVEGRGDPHLNLGQGTVPLDVHRRLWNHPSVETCLLEHWRGEEALVAELAFIQSLNSVDAIE